MMRQVETEEVENILEEITDEETHEESEPLDIKE